MRVIRAYAPIYFENNQSIIDLSVEASHHLAKVLRVRRGDLIQLFDGRGQRFEAKIVDLGKSVSVQIVQRLPSHTESSLDLQLLIALGKGDKMDWIIQKATELGVKSIQPFTSARCAVTLSSERAVKKIQHWQTIIINACEQSGLDVLPTLSPICSFNKALQMTHNRLNLLCDPGPGSQKLTLLLSDPGITCVSLWIGPEGGFTESEISLAEQHRFRLASLGPRILRMETAAISSITLLQALLGDI